METVLSIAGSDSSAGAGVQQDLKVMTALGVYGATVISALTAQNTQGVRAVSPVPAEMLAAQIDAVLDDLNVRAVKTGMLCDAASVEVVAERIRRYRTTHPALSLVTDPVMVSSSGRPLMDEEAVEALCGLLFPLCTLVTPNLPEAQRLVGFSLEDEAAVAEAGRLLTTRFGAAFLLKGGHADGEVMTDRLFLPDGTVYAYSDTRVQSGNLHGTGCTLSSAIASFLALGHPLPEAVGLAKEFTRQAILRGRDLNIGHGNGPLFVPIPPTPFPGERGSVSAFAYAIMQRQFFADAQNKSGTPRCSD